MLAHENQHIDWDRYTVKRTVTNYWQTEEIDENPSIYVVQDSSETKFEQGQWLVISPNHSLCVGLQCACRVLLVLYPLVLYHCNMLTYTYMLI